MSANGIVTARLLDVNFGITAAVNNYDDYANVDAGGKIVLVQLSSPDGTHPHSKYIEFNDERSKIKNAIAHGAAAVIFIILIQIINRRLPITGEILLRKIFLFITWKIRW